MKNIINEILENHTKKNTCTQKYWIKNIQITIKQEENKVVMWAFNHDTDRFVNLSTKKYINLIEGFKDVSSDFYSSDKYYYITLNEQEDHQEESTGSDEYINSLLKQIEELKNEKNKEHKERLYYMNEYLDLKREYAEVNNKYLKLLVAQNEEVHKLKNERGAGRKQKLSDIDIENIKMYRLQGKTIKDIAAIYNCSVGLIHKLINEK